MHGNDLSFYPATLLRFFLHIWTFKKLINQFYMYTLQSHMDPHSYVDTESII